MAPVSDWDDAILEARDLHRASRGESAGLRARPARLDSGGSGAGRRRRAQLLARIVEHDRGDFQHGEDPSRPFNSKYEIGLNLAQEINFFRDHYFGSGDNDVESWRRIDAFWMTGALALAQQLDRETCDTSLALAFEFSDNSVFLFPSDAQFAIWNSWHTEENGTTRVWRVGEREVTAEQLLRRTVLYKVGHHGSRYGTARSGGLELMTDPNLTVLATVDAGLARELNLPTAMPFAPLMNRLYQVTQGRVICSDRPAKPIATGSAVVTNSVGIAQGRGPGGGAGSRPLYIDYLYQTHTPDELTYNQDLVGQLELKMTPRSRWSTKHGRNTLGCGERRIPLIVSALEPDEWLKEDTWKGWFACHSANFKRSIRRSQLITGFQLTMFWSTILRS